MLQSILKIRMYVISNRIMYLYLLFRLHFMQILSRTTARSGSHIQGSCEIRSSALPRYRFTRLTFNLFLCTQQANQGINPLLCLLPATLCCSPHTVLLSYIVVDFLGDKSCCCPVIPNQADRKYMETFLAPHTLNLCWLDIYFKLLPAPVVPSSQNLSFCSQFLLFWA